MNSEFNINAELFRIQNMNSGGSSGGGQGITPDALVQQGLEQTASVLLTRIIGLPLNPSIEGKTIMAQFDLQNMGKNMSLTVATPIRDLPGGLLSGILNYFTRDLPPGLTDGIESGAGPESIAGGSFTGDTGGGGGGEATGGSSGGGSSDSYTSDVQSFAGSDMGSAQMQQVQYGDKLVFTETPEGELGNLKPPTSGIATSGQSEGMSMS